MDRGRVAQWFVASVVVAFRACVSTTYTSEEIGHSKSAVSRPAGISCVARADAVIAKTQAGVFRVKVILITRLPISGSRPGCRVSSR
jgi:hypothetical protein